MVRRSSIPLPKDAILVELREDRLALETRQCLLPGTRVRFDLVMERHALPLRIPVEECLVMDRDRLGFIYQARLSFDGLPEPDRHLIRVFIAKGRGSPDLARHAYDR